MSSHATIPLKYQKKNFTRQFCTQKIIYQPLYIVSFLLYQVFIVVSMIPLLEIWRTALLQSFDIVKCESRRVWQYFNFMWIFLVILFVPWLKIHISKFHIFRATIRITSVPFFTHFMINLHRILEGR